MNVDNDPARKLIGFVPGRAQLFEIEDRTLPLEAERPLEAAQDGIVVRAVADDFTGDGLTDVVVANGLRYTPTARQLEGTTMIAVCLVLATSVTRAGTPYQAAVLPVRTFWGSACSVEDWRGATGSAYLLLPVSVGSASLAPQELPPLLDVAVSKTPTRPSSG